MADKKKKKYTKVGSVMDGQYGKFISLGNDRSKDPKYNYTVQIRVTDGEGKIVQSKNGRLSMMDPRKRPGITEDQASKIPESLVSELFIIQDEE